MKVHNLKVLTCFFEDLVSGRKPFELRNDDRGFQEGDLVVLWNWDDKAKQASGEFFIAKIGYVLRFFGGLRLGWVVFALARPTFMEMAAAETGARKPA